MNDLYRDTILDHYKHPRNYGHLDGNNVSHCAINPSCGDVITMEVRTAKRKGEVRVSEVRFSGQGCAITVATASMLTEKVTGMTISDIAAIGLVDIQAMLGTTLTPSRVKCALLPLEALQRAMSSGADTAA